MMRRIAQLLSVTVLLVAFSVPLAAQQEPTQESIDDLRTRAEAGDAEAQFTLGFMYSTGLGVPPDPAEAVRLWRLAVDQGHVNAQYYLGLISVPLAAQQEPTQESIDDLRTRAEAGDASAQVNLGVMYANGRGVAQDHVQAHVWYNLAAARGQGEVREIAIERRDTIASALTRDQLGEAQRLAREWDAAHPR